MNRLLVCGGRVATRMSLICTKTGPKLSFDTSRVKMQLPDGTSMGRDVPGGVRNGNVDALVAVGVATDEAQPPRARATTKSAATLRMVTINPVPEGKCSRSHPPFK